MLKVESSKRSPLISIEALRKFNLINYISFTNQTGFGGLVDRSVGITCETKLHHAYYCYLFLCIIATFCTYIIVGEVCIVLFECISRSLNYTNQWRASHTMHGLHMLTIDYRSGDFCLFVLSNYRQVINSKTIVYLVVCMPLLLVKNQALSLG